MQYGLNAISLIIASAILAGCATTAQVADTAVRTNLVQEQAHNQLLVLNVLRAYERKPMHFTQISAVRLPVAFGNPTFSLPIPFGGDRTRLYVLETEFGTQQSVDTVVLNSHEFTRGITTPVSPSLMLYYLDQGWPQQLVLHMFVRSIEFFDKNSKLTERIDNYPSHKERFDRFQEVIKAFRDCELDLKSERVYYSASMQYNENLKDLAAARSAGLVPVAFDEKGAVTTDSEKAKSVRFAVESKALAIQLSEGVNGACDGSAVRADQIKATANVYVGPGEPGKRPQNAVRIILRSPEAMIYYLGEIARAQLDGQYSSTAKKTIYQPKGFPWIAHRPLRAADEEEALSKATLFAIEKGVSEGAALTVQYGETMFSVPKSSSDNRTMHVLSLVSQIFALQTKASELPATTSVRLVQ